MKTPRLITIQPTHSASSGLFKKCLAATVIVVSLFVGHDLQATTYYWDANSITPGAGITPNGTWGTNLYWSTSSGGTATTANTPTLIGDTLKFSAGTDTVGAYTVTLNGSQNAGAVVAQTGNLTLSGGTLVLPSTTGASLQTSGTANLAISSTVNVTNSSATIGNNVLAFSPAAGTSIQINGTVTASSSANSVYIQSKGGAGTVDINTNLGSDATLKAALQASGGIAGGLGTLNLNGAQTLGTTQVVWSDSTRIGTLNLGSAVNTGNAVQVGIIQMYSTAGNLTGAVINVNSAVTNTGLTLRSGGNLNVGGSLTNSGGAVIGLISDTTHGATMKILNGGTASLTTINVVDGSVLTNAGTLTGTTLTLGEATGNTSGKFVIGDATGVGSTTVTQITTLGTGTANAIVGGNSAASTLTLNLSAIATYSGKLGGAGTNENNLAFVKQSSPVLTLTGNNTYTGATTVNAGGLKAGVASVAGVSGAFGLNSAVSMANVASAVLDITGFNTQIGSLTGGGSTGGNVTLGAATLTVGGDNTSPAAYGGAISGSTGALTKIGTGTQTFSGVNTYTGATTVSAGTLIIASTGSVSNTSAVTVAGGGKFLYNSSTARTGSITLNGAGSGSAAILGGTGAINTALTLDNVGDTLSPGNSPGIQTYGVNQSWGAFSYIWEVNNFTGTTAGTNFDQIGITGNLTLTGGAGSYILDITSLTAGNIGGNVPNFSETNRSWTILTTTGGISGFDAANWTLSTAGFTTSPVFTGTFTLSKSANDLVLSYAVPEPATWGLLAFSLTTVIILRRRRMS